MTVVFARLLLFVGFASFAYHASYTFVLQIVDFAAMYAFTVLLVALNLRRLRVLDAGASSPGASYYDVIRAGQRRTARATK
jgi:hypothetical protein